MLKPVNADLKSGLLEPPAYGLSDNVFSLGNEIERRSKAVAQFEVHQTLDSAKPSGALDIVGEDESEALAFGPARPSGRGDASSLVNGPTIGTFLPPGPGQPLPKLQPKRQWQQRLD
jgi:hypothetical protein